MFDVACRKRFDFFFLHCNMLEKSIMLGLLRRLNVQVYSIQIETFSICICCCYEFIEFLDYFNLLTVLQGYFVVHSIRDKLVLKYYPCILLLFYEKYC